MDLDESGIKQDIKNKIKSFLDNANRKSVFYAWRNFPSILESECKYVNVNKFAPYPDENEYLKNCYYSDSKNMIKTEKLILKGGGDFEIRIYMFPSEYFDNNRDMFDDLCVEKDKRNWDGKTLEKINIQEAFEKAGIEIGVNMDYFLTPQNLNEIEKHLNRGIDAFDHFLLHVMEMKELGLSEPWTHNKNKYDCYCEKEIEKLESELFFKLMIEIFGDNDESGCCSMDDQIEDENNYYLKNFRLLLRGGNETFASACKGKYYIYTRFLTS